MTQLLRARFSALQDAMLNLIENGADTLEAQIKFWEVNRKMAALQHVARKQGVNRIGHYPLPSLQASEMQAKQAIEMHLLLTSLQRSPYANEPWTMTDTSVELVLQTEPTRTFKKGGFPVTVYYDDDVDNANEYPAWKYIYVMENDDLWHKHESKVSHDGIYYVDTEGIEVYYTWFGPDADRLSRTGRWTVQTENATISSVVTSSNRTRGQAEGKNTASNREVGQSKSTSITRKTRRPPNSETDEESPDRYRSRSRSRSPRTSTPAPKSFKRRRVGSGPGGAAAPTSTTTSTRATSTQRRRGRSRRVDPWPSPEEVGRRHQQLPSTGLSRLARLQQEAWDPPILIIKGPANHLKCWRRRTSHKNHHNKLFTAMSTVFRWVVDESLQSRLLVAFDNTEQREKFLKLIHLPKGCSSANGQLESL